MSQDDAATPQWAGQGCGPVVVTGARGFVGANLCRHLLRRGLQVVALEGPVGPNWRLQQEPGLQLLAADITEAQPTVDLLRSLQPLAIVNCAAYGAYSVQADVPRTYAVNVDGTRHVLEGARACPSLRAIIQLGTSSEYGVNCTRPSEDAALWPDSHYAVTKVAATAMARYYAIKHRVPAFVLRLYSVYGPYEDMSRLIPKMLSLAQVGELPPLAHPQTSRDFVYIDDVCRAVEAVIARAPTLQAGDVYNIGSGVCTRLCDLVSAAQQLFEVTAEPVYTSQAARPWDHHKRWVADPAHAAAALQWQATTSLHAGLQQTEHWLRQHPQLVAAAQAHSVTARPC